VAAGRGLTQEEELAVAKGQIWSGADAKAAGLVDALGGYQKAVALAKEAAGIAEETAVAIRPFPEARDPFAALLEDAFDGDLDSPGTRALLRSLTHVAEALAPLIQAAETLTADPRSQTLQSPVTFPVK